MNRYGPQGLGHMALARLESGPATLAEIREALGLRSAAAARKAWHPVRALIFDGFVTADSGDYEITVSGRIALARLRAGEDVETGGVPSVRIFARDAAGGNAPAEAA